MSNSTVGAPAASVSDGNAGLGRSLGMRGPGRRVWVAEVSGPERIRACQTQLVPIQLAIQCLRRWASGGLGWGCVFALVAVGFGLG